jgi:hypothetical protein
MMKRVVVGIVGVLGVCACSGSAIEVGPGSAGAAGTNAGGGAAASGATGNPNATCTDSTPLPEWPSTTACAGTSDLPVVGRWHGYVENESAPWDELFLEIKGANGSGLCGTLTVGNTAPPPPATDPAADYPPGADSEHSGWLLVPGYPLTLLDGTVDGTRVRFRVSGTEAYKSWCALQTPYQQMGRNCGCVPRGSTTLIGDKCVIVDYIGGATRAFNCAQSQLCGGPGPSACTCDASGCGPLQDDENAFDLVVTGDTAEGSVSRVSGGRTHFTRLP